MPSTRRTGHGTLSLSSGGSLTIIAAILDPTVIAKILTHLSYQPTHSRYDL
jgi:hypothetical protein